MKTKKEYYEELYDLAETEVKTNRATIELVIIFLVVVPLSFWMGLFAESFTLLFTEMVIFVAVLFYMTQTKTTITPVSEAKIKRQFRQEISDAAESLQAMIADTEETIRTETEEASRLWQELELLKQISIDAHETLPVSEK